MKETDFNKGDRVYMARCLLSEANRRDNLNEKGTVIRVTEYLYLVDFDNGVSFFCLPDELEKVFKG